MYSSMPLGIILEEIDEKKVWQQSRILLASYLSPKLRCSSFPSAPSAPASIEVISGFEKAGLEITRSLLLLLELSNKQAMSSAGATNSNHFTVNTYV